VKGSLEGNGHRVASEHYRFQGLDLVTRPYGDSAPWVRLLTVVQSRSLATKYIEQFTPYGTPVAQVVRLGGELLIAPCGNCGVPVGKHTCDFRTAS
jgi:hypothetical protein